ncbi:NADH-quinone oxidoreductase subunit NuoN [Speluncibacter jeojiensis]|uniref:NADH-quinone oxidoreductase subunit N n=1 Tax=Speluncibacter jeojiensis TaxID=2710754 RepID=A0A9X4LYQ7_9ACTN|nr:NADH-quinone oxidoreductase subunit NuoN [Corynebacteriales bacterium D3-21]
MRTVAPSIEYSLLVPMLVVFGVAVAGVLVEAFAPRRFRYGGQLVLTVGGLAGAFVAVALLAGTRRMTVMGAVAVDGPTLTLQGVIVLVALVAVPFLAERQRLSAVGAGASVAAASVTAPAGVATAGVPTGRLGGADAFTGQAAAVPGSAAERAATESGRMHTEVFPLTMFAVGGMMLFPAASDLLTMFVALEVLSLPLYLLCGLARGRRLRSQEAALKYFLLGAFSSAFFLYGVALLYGFAGTVNLAGIAAALERQHDNRTLAIIGIAVLCVGLFFKISAVPFHAWTPDVYQGAPTPITAFMSAATKIAAFGALLRVLYVAVPSLADDWRPMLWVVAIATMVVGVVMAVTATDVKRMLAYSSISHTGFILTAVIALDRDGLSSSMFYLIAYGFSTLGAFAITGMVRSRTDPAREVTDLAAWTGVGRRSPALGACFSILLLSFAGIPLTSGFVSKFAVFLAALSAGGLALVIVGVICSAVAAYFYIRVIVLMFFAEPPEDGPVIVVPSVATRASIALTAAVTVVLGIWPQPLLDLVNRAAEFLH